MEVVESCTHHCAMFLDELFQDRAHPTKPSCHRCSPVGTNRDQLFELDVVFDKFVENEASNSIAGLVATNIKNMGT